MKPPLPARRKVMRALGWLLVPGLITSIYLAYRWAEPSRATYPPATVAGGGSRVTIRLENTPFAAYAGGHKTWSLHAGSVVMERPLGSTLSNIQTAILTDIRDGALFQLPSDPPRPPLTGPTSYTVGTDGSTASTSSKKDGSPAATFRAKEGRYTLGNVEPLPPDLAQIFSLQWQFKLQGDVTFHSRTGDTMQADTLAIVEMMNFRSSKLERRVVADNGATVKLKDIQIQTNKARYDPVSRQVECLGGVRGAFKDGTVQAERLYWSLKDEILRCPETASGEIKKMPFTAEGLTVDHKNRKLHANHVQVRFRIDEGEIPRLR